MQTGEEISLNKYISATGFCSRREADKLIEQARVTINGELALTGAKVLQGDIVAVDDEPLKAKKKPVYVAFNKPVGVTSTTDTKDRSNIISFINYPKRIFPIGRLDKDSDGLIFLTNDGDIVNKILRASNNHDKEYIVYVDKAINTDFVKGMSNGVPILGELTKRCMVKQEGNKRFRIILTQGLNRQIRRMCEYFGYKVVKLTRVRIMNVTLGSLATGKWRYLSAAEVDTLEQMVSTSSKTAEHVVKQPRKNTPKKQVKEDKTPVPKKTVPKETKSAKPKNSSYKDWKKKR